MSPTRHQRSVAILAILALIGVGTAFAFVGVIVSETYPPKDVWLYQNPVSREPLQVEDQRQNAIEIRKQNEGKVTGINRLSGEGVMESEIRIAIGDKVETPKFIRGLELTEEVKEKAKEIALSNLKVKEIVAGKVYELKIKGIAELRMDERGEAEPGGASVAFEFEDGTLYFVHVDLKKGEVIRISPPILPSQNRGIPRQRKLMAEHKKTS